MSVADWPGFSVIGKVIPDIVKPVPVIVAALTVTAEVPVDVRVSGCVDGTLMVTFPNDKLVALMLRVGVPVAVAVPVPLRLITAVPLVEELLVIVT